MRIKCFLLGLLCLLGTEVFAANATLDDMYNAANELIGNTTYTFFNFGGPDYGYRTKEWGTYGDLADSSRTWSDPDHQPIVNSMTGLIPSITYDVYVIAGGKVSTGTTEDWGVQVGFAPDEYSLVTVDIGDDATLTKYNLGLYNNGSSYPFREVQSSAASACMWAVLAGTVVTDESGNTTVYVNDCETININGSVGDRTWYDGLLLTPTASPNHPVPADGETGVAADNLTLSWLGGRDPNGLYISEGYYVYLGTSSDNLILLNTALLSADTSTYNVGAIDMNTTYYWQVEQAMDNGLGGVYGAGDPNNNLFGPVWSFSSVFSTPSITEEPVSQVVMAGETAEFSVGVDSISSPTVKWYYSADNATDTPADDAFLSTNEILTLTDVTVANEGFYYCVVNNDSNIPVSSATASLALGRLMAHWTFDQNDYVDGQYLDVSGENHPADPNGTPAFAAGQVNEGIDIVCNTGNGPSTGSWGTAGSWNPSEISGMVTISFWMNWGGPDNDYTEQIFLSKRSGVTLAEATQWQLSTATSNTLSLQSPTSLVQAHQILDPGKWQHIVVCCDGTTAVIYINGKPAASGSFTLGDAANATINLGGRNFANEPAGWMNGVLDEVKIFNYALSDVEVAKIFVADNPGSTVCVQSLKPQATYDINDDCVVNLEDVALLISNWLDCGIVPDCVD